MFLTKLTKCFNYIKSKIFKKQNKDKHKHNNKDKQKNKDRKLPSPK